jgi:hypothetical protein
MSQSNYLIGTNKCLCELRGNKVMIRIGGGYESFSEYMHKNEKHIQRQLVIGMIKSEQSLEYVVQKLMTGARISELEPIPAKKGSTSKKSPPVSTYGMTQASSQVMNRGRQPYIPSSVRF